MDLKEELEQLRIEREQANEASKRIQISEAERREIVINSFVKHNNRQPTEKEIEQDIEWLKKAMERKNSEL